MAEQTREEHCHICKYGIYLPDSSFGVTWLLDAVKSRHSYMYMERKHIKTCHYHWVHNTIGDPENCWGVPHISVL